MFSGRMSNAEMGYMAECFERENAINRFINMFNENPTADMGEQHLMGHQAGIDLNDLTDAELRYIQERVWSL